MNFVNSCPKNLYKRSPAKYSMLKNWKTATMWAIISWVLIFVAISVIMFTPALIGNSVAQNALELLILPVIAYFSAYMALKDEKPRASDGFALGIYFVIIGTVLDLLITVPLFTKSYDFFMSWMLWAGYAEGIIFCTIAGYRLSLQEKRK